MKELKEIKTFIHQIAKENNSHTQLTTSDEECEVFFDSIRNNPSQNRHFYLALHTPTNVVTFQHNLKEFFGLKKDATLEDFIGSVHPNYQLAFFQWAKSAHLLLASHPEFVQKGKNVTYKIMIPLRNRDGEYYWVMQECTCLQASVEGQMITQFNTYTVTYRYDNNHPQEIMGWMSGEQTIDHTKDALLKQFYNKISNFNLTFKEKELLCFVKNHTDLSYREIAPKLEIAEETVKRHSKNITLKVKDAFPHHFSKNDKLSFKTVINYLERLEFFD